MVEVAPSTEPRRPGPLRQILAFWKAWVLILTPIILLPLPILEPSTTGRCAYGTLVMAIYWMTEAIPLAATALIPVALFPWLGVLGSKELCKNYLKDTNMLFVGGLLVAVAVEKWNLHKRIALRVLLLVGSQPRWLMFGFMVTTAFLSMWISNTATTAMMVPIAQAVLMELSAHKRHEAQRVAKESNAIEMEEQHTTDATEMTPLSDTKPNLNGSPPEPFLPQEPVSNSIQITGPVQNEDDEDPGFVNLCKGLTLSVAYAANIGGTATLTGTGPNLVLKGQLDTLFGEENGVSFSSWFIYAFPNMVLSLLLAWIWLQFLFLGPKVFLFWRKSDPTFDTAKVVIRREYEKLGSMSFAEGAVLGHFIVLALLWITRQPQFMPGWSELFTPGYVTDASTGITIAVLLFMFPSRFPRFLCLHRKNDPEPPGPSSGLLDWDTVHKKMAWSVVLILGGGFALADACQKSGLSAAIGEAFGELLNIPVWALVIVLSTITAVFTEVTSNTATATIFLPILAELAKSIQVNPLYLMMPVTLSASFAFMLPVATPPNAIVFAYGHMKVFDMVKAGIVMNIVCILVVAFSINTWGHAYFRLGEFPEWAGNLQTNLSSLPPNILQFTTSTP